MANSEHLAKLKEGVEAWDGWRKANPDIVPDLRGADLREADLTNAELFGANLSGASLGAATLSGAVVSRASLTWADLGAADLTGVCLESADLRYANFSNAHLSRALLSAANLTLANLNGADLGEMDLSGAYVNGTIFGDNDLSTVKGLETVQHKGPSTIGIDTIYRSQGKIPLAFLRGAGVPENFIEYMGSLTGKTLEFYSCFISHSTKDSDFADRLYADLQNKGVRCWFAPHDMQGGEHIIEQVDRAIRIHERLLLILSTDSMKSKWVETEIVKARKREVVEDKRVLFPVSLVPFGVLQDWKCFDSDTGEDLAREIRKYYIPDFSNWKNHDHYAEGLKKLLGGLKTEGSKAA